MAGTLEFCNRIDEVVLFSPLSIDHSPSARSCRKPLALAVIGGLVLSTPVTLLAVPGLYAAVKVRK